MTPVYTESVLPQSGSEETVSLLTCDRHGQAVCCTHQRW